MMVIAERFTKFVGYTVFTVMPVSHIHHKCYNDPVKNVALGQEFVDISGRDE
jgi:hypothetical protein